MARVIDLDAARIARAEAQGEAPVIRFGGQDWTLPSELPWAVAEAAAANDGPAALAAIRLLLGSQWAEFSKLNPSLSDVAVLLEGVGEIYGASPGK